MSLARLSWLVNYVGALAFIFTDRLEYRIHRWDRGRLKTNKNMSETFPYDTFLQ